jgi:pSer/pThr/pTyr-binding forkhead associated (FHA) protein
MAGEQLRVIEGKERGKCLSVDADLLIGRSAPDDDGRLGDDPEISRRHARVSRGVDSQLTIEDLGSANGTFVNDLRIATPRILDLGDVIKVGRTVLRVTDPTGAVPGETRPPTEAPVGESSSESAQPGEELLVTAVVAEGRRLTLIDELVLGRGVSGEGRLSDDHELSRRHARVARDASGRLTIEDLGSANGTFVNGERVLGRQVLEVGDSVRVGSTTLQLAPVGRPTDPLDPATPRAAPTPLPAPDPPPAHTPLPAPDPPPAHTPLPAPDPLPAHTPLPAPTPPAPPPVRAKRANSPAAPSTDRAVVASELPLGSVFAGCRLQEIIGHGDMGVVYRAEELALQRQVALKLILPEHSREERFRERFRRESRIAAAIDHPNVIPIFDAGVENDMLFITMRLVAGTDLRARIAAEGRLEPLRAARIIRQVGAALDAAHARGMLHRDVKPSNVLLAREDHVYLSDFGLAKRQSASVGGLTRHGSIVARAEYVAPEQILNERVDARADVYALGCLLFETLTGEAPFTGWTDGPQALAHIDAPRPSPVELCPDVPDEFDDVVKRAMATDPGERYPSAGDLGRAALVAAGGLRRARPWSVVATGDAAPSADVPPADALAATPARALAATPGRAPAATPERAPAAIPAVALDGAQAARARMLRWVIALASLAIVAAGMVAALIGISSL